MSWRRFLVLLRNLSPRSGWAELTAAAAKRDRVISDPAAAQRFFDGI